MKKMYNGIILPDKWPPNGSDPNDMSLKEKPEWVKNVEEPIPVALGRQLFVDDFLIAGHNLFREFHQVDLYENNPILTPETKLEMNNGICPVACPFSDGVFFDSNDNLYKMWYHAGWFDGTAYATSRDGFHWERPDLGVGYKNQVLPSQSDFRRDGVSVWLDHDALKENERYKMFLYARSKKCGDHGYLYSSADGIHWKERGRTGICGDNTTFFYNPFSKQWVFTIRSTRRDAFKSGHRINRTRDYFATHDFFHTWKDDEPVYWTGTDWMDSPDPMIGDFPQLYKIDAVGYESLLVGVFTVLRGPSNEICLSGKYPKITDLQLAFSRDGFTWDRPCRHNFIGATRMEGDWNRGYLHSVGGTCLVLQDQIRFYFGGWSGLSPRNGGDIYAGGSTGMGILRRDGFASMNSNTTTGFLKTKRMVLSGKFLFANIDTSGGKLCVGVLNKNQEYYSGFTPAECCPVSIDSVKTQIFWKEKKLQMLEGEEIQLEFFLTKGKIYSFWFSETDEGHSYGYVGAGGPGYIGNRDI